MFAELAITTPALVGLAIADHITGTAWYQKRGNTMSNLEFTGWDDIDPTETVEFWELPEPTEEDIAAALDIDGIDIDGYGSEHGCDDASALLDSVAWLHSLMYSDYADPSDDDDRAEMTIPRSVLERSTGGLF